MSKQREQSKKAFKKTILIICPGEIEQGYFQSLKMDRYCGLQITIEPRLGKADRFEKVFKRIIQDYGDGMPGTCYYVNDMDAIIAQSLLDKYQKVKEKALQASQGMLTMIETMPCFEYWFLLHELFTTKCYPSYESLKKDIRDAIPDYDKNEAWAKKIYDILKDKIDFAMANSRKSTENKRNNEGACSYTNMHELIEHLDRMFSKHK